MNTRILIADDHTLFRQGLVALLSEAPELEVVAEAAGGREAIRIADKLQPDMVLLDLSMPDLDGMESARAIRSKNPGIRLVALTMHKEPRRVRDALQAGFDGYVLKDEAFDALRDAITCAVAGKFWMSPSLSPDPPEETDPLSEREQEVVRRLASGATFKEIAHGMEISIKTVETYRQRAARKLGLRSLAELSSWAARAGLV